MAGLAFAALAMSFAGCGSAGTPIIPPPMPKGTTNVTVLLTSTANDQLVKFYVSLASITLTDSTGNNVSLYNNASALISGGNGTAEFMHLNGGFEPLTTVTVPQGTYPSAAVTVGYCNLTTITIDTAGGVDQSTDAEGLCGQGAGMATVNLPSPLVISGSAMALSLDLQVSQSYTLSGTGAPPPAGYTISPVFNLTSFAIASPPTSQQNGRSFGIGAQITSVNQATNSFVAQTADGIPLTIESGDSTAYQGIAGFANLAAGTLANLDLAIQPDASLLATRIEVDDPAALMTSTGPVIVPGSQAQQFLTLPVGTVGCTITGTPSCGNIFQYESTTVFGASGEFTNVQNLPFAASFNATTLILGQNVSNFSPGTILGQGYELAPTVILLPQVINGTVTAVSSNQGFLVYTVALAPYDLIPTLQGQVGPITRLNSPVNVVYVYADTNTRLFNSAPLNAGSLLRFRGLLFDDNGTLRMDCDQINDGVPE